LHKVLIADDEHNIRNILDFSLHAEGFLVISALDGEQAFKLAVESKPDLIILDVMMPGLGGVETCRILKGDLRTAEIPVILLTALAGRDDRRLGSEAGADAYIIKPFSPQRVIEVVHDLLPVTSD
jgi:DNA-binding response OmpR family regulator